MDSRANSGMFFLHDEKFDFDVSLSPASSGGEEDEDEVFVGPVISHTERCVSVNVASRLEDRGGGGGGLRASWSPLTADQLEAVCEEANKLVHQLSRPISEEEKNVVDMTTESTTADVMTTESIAEKEEFHQDTGTKLSALGSTASVLSPIKRQTFCVQDSPRNLLPPAVQRRLLRGSSASNPASVNRSGAAAYNTRGSTSSPGVVAVKAQPRTGLRGKAGVGVAVVLPSRHAAPTTTTNCSASKSRVDKTRLQPPGKASAGLGSRRLSPVSQPSSRAGSCEDLLSDSASVASDVSDSSLNNGLPGKRSLGPPPAKVMRNMSGLKAPPAQSRRKNTSSSSSSVSSINSSISLSPAKGKLNSSLNRSVSVGPAHSSSVVSRATNHSRPRRSTVYAPPEPATVSTATTRRSMSTQARKLSEVDRVKPSRSTPLRRAETTPQKMTPAAKRVLERNASIPAAAGSSLRQQSTLKSKTTKPEAVVLPTTSAGGKAADVSKRINPKRLTSSTSVDSFPQKSVVAPLTPSAGGGSALQFKPRRPSALPTPVRRRMSCLPVPTPTKLPVATPTNLPRSNRPPPTTDCNPAPSPVSMKRDRSCSPAPSDTQEAESVDDPDIAPFCLEEEEESEPPSAAPLPPQLHQSQSSEPGMQHGTEHCQGQSKSSDPGMEPGTEPSQESGVEPGQDQSQSSEPGAEHSQSQSEPSNNLIELESKEESNSKTQEVLLLDLPAPILRPQEKLLIDLTNTPVLTRNTAKTGSTNQQLIDLSSPLIKWSPEEKSENSAPLINLSF